MQGTVPVDVDVAVDVSGWLHTTEAGYALMNVAGDDFVNLVAINTTGYRQITVKVQAAAPNCKYIFYMCVGYECWTDMEDMGGLTHWEANDEFEVAVALPVTSELLRIWVLN